MGKVAIIVWICDFCGKESEPIHFGKSPMGWIAQKYEPEYDIAVSSEGVELFKVWKGPLHTTDTEWCFCCEDHQQQFIAKRNANITKLTLA